MKVKNFDPLDMPKDMFDSWSWVCAIDAWDYCYPAPLSALILTEDIPAPLRPVIANIISGKRTQKKRAAVKLKIPAAERMKIAGSVSTILGLISSIQSDIIDDNYPGLSGAEMLSYTPKHGCGTTSGIISNLRKEAADTIQYAADHFNVSVETIENLLRDLRGKINNWPDL